MPRRVYFIGVAGRRTIHDPEYDGLILRDDEQMRIVDFYSNLSAGGQFIPLVVEHDPSQQIGVVRHLWMLSDTRLGIIGELRGEAPVAREALLGRTLGLSVELAHPYDKAQHRIVGDRRINHVGVVVEPCWDDHRTYIKDISNDLDTIENVFLNDYYKMAVHMSQRDRARWGQLLMEKQKMATSGFSEGATREPEGIIYLRTGYNTTHTPQFTTTAPMDTTPTPSSSSSSAPPATDEWSTLIKEYGATPEQLRAALEASRGQGLDLMEAVELARKKRLEDEEAAERKRREEAESIVAMNKQWIDTFAPYIKDESDMAFALSKMEPSATLSGSDMARMLMINTTASKAMQEALDHRKKEELYQAERAAKKAEAEAAAAKTAAAAAQQKAREAPAAAPKMETHAPASSSYSDYYVQLRKKREEDEQQQQRESVDFTSTAASKGGAAAPAAPTSAFLQTLSRLHGDINVDRFDGNRFSSISARGVDPFMFTASENSLRSHARPVGSEFEAMRGQVFQVELPTGGH